MPTRRIHPPWMADYALKECEDPKELVVLLHGWQQHGEIILHIMERLFGPRSLLLAPNGPFPAPYPTKGGYRKTYGWYFFDVKTSEYLVPMDFSVDYVGTLVDALGYGALPKRVVGFSMGAYVAPFIADGLTDVRQVVGVNGRYRSEVLARPLPFRVDAVHGAEDEVVDPVRAQACHGEVLAAGNTGLFRLVPGCGHKPGEALMQALGGVLALGEMQAG